MKRKTYILLSLTLIVMIGGLTIWNFSANSVSAQKNEDAFGALEYNAAREFALTQGGTSGVWRYGYSASQVDNAFTEFTTNDSIAACGGQFLRWLVLNSDTVPQIAAHNQGTTCSNIPGSAVFIHPGQTVIGGSDPVRRAVVRWTAPASGTFQLIGSLQRQSPAATTDLKIIKNAATANESVVFSGSNVSTYQLPYNVSVIVSAGDTLDFSVGDGGNGYNSDASSIAINISQPITSCLIAPANLQVNVPAENSPSDVQSINTNASLVGDAAYTNTGKVGRSFDLDGSGDYVRIEDNAAQRPAAAVTAEGWFKFDSVGGIVSLISKPIRNSSLNSYTLYLEGGQLRGLMGNASQYTRALSSFVPQTGVWHHLAFTYDYTGGVSTLRLYANGVDVTSSVDGTANLPLFYDANPYPFLIGADYENNTPTFFLDGQADEVSVYGRALAQSEIFDIVQQGSFGKCAPTPCAQTPNNLVSWFAGEGNALDSKSNNHGASQNGATFANGKVGQAFSFDGADDKVSVPNSPSLDITGNQLTIEAWINPSNVAGDRQIVSMASSVAQPSGRKIGLYVQNGSLGFEVNTNGGYGDPPVSGAVSANVWTHVAGVYDGSQMIWYINGSAVGSAGLSGNIVPSSGSFAIGQFAAVNASSFQGLIDEVAIYNRALSQSELQSIVNAGLSGKCKPIATNPASNQIAWFSGDGDARDFLGLNPNGILRGDANYRVGRVGQSFNFDGSGDYVEIADDADHRPANQLTAEGWFKINSFANIPHLIAKGLRGNDGDSYAMWFGNGNIRIGYSDSSSNLIFYDTGYVPNLGEFNHYALVLNTDDTGVNANTLKLYVNGAEVFSGAAFGSIYYDTVNPHPLTIGADINNDVPDFSLNGQADEVSLYSRALSASEISAIYNAGSAGKVKSMFVNAAPPLIAKSRKAESALFRSNYLIPAAVQLSDATVTFDNVTASGTVSENGIDLGLLPALPPSATFTGLAYDVSTTAAYMGNVSVCFNVPSLTNFTFSNLRILHLENGVWVNRTATGNNSPNLCTTALTSLSPFVIVQTLAPTAAGVLLGGQVTDAYGRGIGGVSVTLTDSQGRTLNAKTGTFGKYSFSRVPAGEIYIVSVYSRRYTFGVSSQAVNLLSSVKNVDFTASESRLLDKPGKTEQK